MLKNGDAAETNPAWECVLGLGFSLAFHAAPVALVVSAWGAPWWATVLLGLAGGLVFGDLAGGFMAWYLLESVAGVDSWLLLSLGAGVGVLAWSGVCSMALLAAFALFQVRVRPPTLRRWKRGKQDKKAGGASTPPRHTGACGGGFGAY